MTDRVKEVIKTLPYQDMKDTVLMQKYQCWSCRSRNVYVSITAPNINVLKYPVCCDLCAKGFEHAMKELGLTVLWNEATVDWTKNADKTIMMKKLPCICGKKHIYVGVPMANKDIDIGAMCCGQCAEKYKAAVKKDGRVTVEA